MGTLLIFFILLTSQYYACGAPSGHKSYVYQRCLNLCTKKNCTSSMDDISSNINHWDYMNLRKSCRDECAYNCMWNAVDAYKKDGLPVPQFYGKWPFKQIWGMQEPASVIFSIINCLVDVVMIYKFVSMVPRTAPMYNIYCIYGIVSIIAWLCAIVFHIRDRTFTELLDYGGAISFVFYNIFTVLMRISYGKATKVRISGFLPIGLFYCFHIYSLIFENIDYGYNMEVLLVAGAFNVVLWLSWCFLNKDSRPYVWKAAVTMLLVSAIAPLEIYDFPPLWWVFDAHSLWHAFSIPASYMILSFAIDDALHLTRSSKRE